MLEKEFRSEIYEEPYDETFTNGRKLLIISILVLLSGILMKLYNIPGWVWVVFPPFLVIMFYQHFDLKDRPVIGEPLGDLVLNNKGIQIGPKLINCSDISSLRVVAIYWRNQRTSLRYAVYAGGTENFLELKLKNNELIKLHFMVLNSNHKKDLTMALEALKEKGVNLNI